MKRSIVVAISLVLVAVIAFLIGRNTIGDQPQAVKNEVEKKVALSFAGAEKHEVTLADAKKFIQNYRKGSKTLKAKADEIKGGSLERAIFDKILAQPDCKGIRFYYAQNDDGSPTMVFIGITAEGKDMTAGSIAEWIKPCPPFCDVATELK